MAGAGVLEAMLRSQVRSWQGGLHGGCFTNYRFEIIQFFRLSILPGLDCQLIELSPF